MPSQVLRNALVDPSYCPYCMRCSGLARMVKVEPFLWRHFCGAIHDEREEAKALQACTACAGKRYGCAACKGEGFTAKVVTVLDLTFEEMEAHVERLVAELPPPGHRTDRPKRGRNNARARKDGKRSVVHAHARAAARLDLPKLPRKLKKTLWRDDPEYFC